MIKMEPMKTLICAIAFGLLALVGTSYAHCGSCGVGDEAHAAESAENLCSKCGHEKGSAACAEACAKAEKCSHCGAVKGSEECRKNCGG